MLENKRCAIMKIILLGGGKMDNGVIKQTVKTGVSFGSALAIVISYVHWHSILWAIIHGVFGWFYVIYYIIFY